MKTEDKIKLKEFCDKNGLTLIKHETTDLYTIKENECMRVLKPDGVLIFKWNENQIKINDIVKLIETKPLFGHPSGRNGQTIWMTFMKE